MPEALKTFFASAERSPDEELIRQINLIKETPIIMELFNSVPGLVAILNSNRQIVFANNSFVELFKGDDYFTFVGQRPGEAIKCYHSDDCEAGCGTSEACSVCGAVSAILLSQFYGKAKSECKIILKNGDPLDLMVNTNQYKIGGEEFTIFAATDISDHKRRIALERIFFHDLLNITGVLRGYLDILPDALESEREEYIHYSKNVTEHLIEEIASQKELSLAEERELSLNITSFSTLDILKETSILYEKHIVSQGKKIIILQGSDDVIIRNDKTLLRRSLGNLTKNALEAINEGGVVTLGSKSSDGHIEFSVHNEMIIPRKIQLQIFQRSFSTKGRGRGLGTYSVKLLTERYLKGKVYFISNENEKTTFYLKFPHNIEE